MVTHTDIQLPAFDKGFHLITDIVRSELGILPISGILNLFIKHSSAGLTINENADPTVRDDFETTFNRIVPENNNLYTHVFEGSDDMPAHIKASLTGFSVTIPISNGRLNLGTWQGIYLCEFRNHGGRRKLVASVLE